MKDGGETFQHSDGTRVSLPTTAETVTVIDKEHTDLRYGSIAVSPSGTLHVLYSSDANLLSEAWITWLEPSVESCRRPLLSEIPKDGLQKWIGGNCYETHTIGYNWLWCNR
ncbi:hypothetical protein H8E77_33470 [bacterium]|nr:hypothetical protein [bacterium]